MLSLGYLNEDGTLKTTNFQRYTGRVNVDSKITDWFSANMGLNVGYSVSNFSNYTGSSNSNVWYTAQFVNPLYPVYLKDANGNTIYKNGDSNGDNDVDVGDVMNLVDYICKDTPETFIKEVSDIDEDNTVDVNDIMGVIDIIME